MRNCSRLQVSWALLLCGLLGLPTPGQAQSAESAASPPEIAARPVAQEQISETTMPAATREAADETMAANAEVAQAPGTDTALFGAQKADLAVLDTQRGGADTTINTVMNDIHTSGSVTGNEAYNLSTGMNSIADGAFVGAQGFSTVVQNSGNNVLIQNSTIINIQLK